MMSDGWGSKVSNLNQVGTVLVIVSTVITIFAFGDMVQNDVPVTVLFIAVAICGLIGGALYVIGRAPVVAGAFIGLVITVGGFGAAYWWSQFRNGPSVYEVAVVTFVGTLPGFLLQRICQRIFARRTDTNE
jgi:hypothetical protein